MKRLLIGTLLVLASLNAQARGKNCLSFDEQLHVNETCEDLKNRGIDPVMVKCPDQSNRAECACRATIVELCKRSARMWNYDLTHRNPETQGIKNPLYCYERVLDSHDQRCQTPCEKDPTAGECKTYVDPNSLRTYNYPKYRITSLRQFWGAQYPQFLGSNYLSYGYSHQCEWLRRNNEVKGWGCWIPKE